MMVSMDSPYHACQEVMIKREVALPDKEKLDKTISLVRGGLKLTRVSRPPELSALGIKPERRRYYCHISFHLCGNLYANTAFRGRFLVGF